MRIAVVAPSEQYTMLAGVRIRYQRIAARLELLGHSLRLLQISDFRKNATLDDDIYLFSKCYDARSYIVANILKTAGKCVGFDFFDDYFGQTLDSRFVRHREWVRTISDMCDFYLCSTPRMRDVIIEYMPGIPGYVLNDPFDAFDVPHVANVIKHKLAKARKDRAIDVVWFGVGDNPHFPIGLRDLSAYSGALEEIQNFGFNVNLHILTNRRALNVQGLENINRISIPHHVEEWSEEREKEMLEDSLLAFIPVNAQAFSIAKSLNRAVTAITGGCQVLSPGYPLYQPLGDFIYDSAPEFTRDIDASRLKVRPATMSTLTKQLAIWGNPDRETSGLAKFLLHVLDTKNTTGAAVEPSLIGVVHGKRSPADCHKSAQRLGQLSISSPFSVKTLNYDVRFLFNSSGTEIQLSATAVSKLSSHFREHLRPVVSPLGKDVKSLALQNILPGHPLCDYQNRSILHFSRAAVYGDAIRLIRDVCERIFPNIAIYLSELDAPLMETRIHEKSPPARLTSNSRKASA